MDKLSNKIRAGLAPYIGTKKEELFLKAIQVVRAQEQIVLQVYEISKLKDETEPDLLKDLFATEYDRDNTYNLSEEEERLAKGVQNLDTIGILTMLTREEYELLVEEMLIGLEMEAIPDMDVLNQAALTIEALVDMEGYSLSDKLRVYQSLVRTKVEGSK